MRVTEQYEYDRCQEKQDNQTDSRNRYNGDIHATSFGRRDHLVEQGAKEDSRQKRLVVSQAAKSLGANASLWFFRSYRNMPISPVNIGYPERPVCIDFIAGLR